MGVGINTTPLLWEVFRFRINTTPLLWEVFRFGINTTPLLWEVFRFGINTTPLLWEVFRFGINTTPLLWEVFRFGINTTPLLWEVFRFGINTTPLLWQVFRFGINRSDARLSSALCGPTDWTLRYNIYIYRRLYVPNIFTNVPLCLTFTFVNMERQFQLCPCVFPATCRPPFTCKTSSRVSITRSRTRSPSSKSSLTSCCQYSKTIRPYLRW